MRTPDVTVLECRMEGEAFRPKAVPGQAYDPVRRERHERARVVTGQGEVRIEHWAPRLVALTTNATTGVAVKVGQFHFPGWTASREDGGPLSVRPSGEDGLVEVDVPAGEHWVVLKLEPTLEERAGRAATAVGLGVLVALFGWFRRLDGVTLSR